MSKMGEEELRDLEKFTREGIPRGLLPKRNYHSADARAKDKDPPRRDDYLGPEVTGIGDSQIKYLDKPEMGVEQK